MDLQPLLESSGAILHGHFLLTSGRHSDVYFEKFRILEQPKVLTALCQKLCNDLRSEKIDFVAGPTTGGIIVAFEMARQLGLPAVYVEMENGARALRRGKSISKGARVLVVDDVLTTGTSLRETGHAIERARAQPVAFAVLIDRAETELQLGAPLYVCHKVRACSYAASDVPEWLSHVPITKPGTRGSAV